jgi:hypothetical protein
MNVSRSPIEQTLRSGKQWLNGGECCGQKDSAGTCAAPACIMGEALKWFHRAADELERRKDLQQSAEAERDLTLAENRTLRKLLGEVRAHLVAVQLNGLIQNDSRIAASICRRAASILVTDLICFVIVSFRICRHLRKSLRYGPLHIESSSLNEMSYPCCF